MKPLQYPPPLLALLLLLLIFSQPFPDYRPGGTRPRLRGRGKRPLFLVLRVRYLALLGSGETA